MRVITTGFNFGSNCCVGCFKPLNRWNTRVVHNNKCLRKYNRLLDKLSNKIENFNIKGASK